MHLGHVGPHPEVRLRDPHQGADLACVIHAKLDDGCLRAAPQLEQREGQPDVVVEVALVPQHAIAGPEQGGCQLLRRGLADAAGDRDDPRAGIAGGPRARCAGAPRPCRRRRSRPAVPARAGRQRRGVGDDGARRPPAERLPNESMPVEARLRGWRRTRHRAGRAGCRSRSGPAPTSGRPRCEAPAGRRQRARRRETRSRPAPARVLHPAPAPARLRARAVRATDASRNGTCRRLPMT